MRDPQAAAVAMVVLLLVVPIVLLVAILPYWKIFKKAGFHPALSLAMLVPIVNIIVLYVVAFSDWKVVPISELGWPPNFPPSYPQPTMPPQMGGGAPPAQ